MTAKASRRLGDVIQLALPNGDFAYGRVLRDAAVGFYPPTDNPSQLPVGRRDYRFVVGVEDSVFSSPLCNVVGNDPPTGPEDEWPPPQSVRDPISGRYQVYERGKVRLPFPTEDPSALEPAAIWAYEHLVERLLKGGSNGTVS